MITTMLRQLTSGFYAFLAGKLVDRKEWESTLRPADTVMLMIYGRYYEAKVHQIIPVLSVRYKGKIYSNCLFTSILPYDQDKIAATEVFDGLRELGRKLKEARSREHDGIQRMEWHDSIRLLSGVHSGIASCNKIIDRFD